MRAQILEATEARMLAQEQRGVGTRGAAKLKAERTAKPSSGPAGGSGANMMRWSMGT